MIDILMWISIVTGGILVLMLLLSILGGLDLDMDFNFDFNTDTDTDVGHGGLGVFKGALAFVSIATWVAKIVLVSGFDLYLVLLISLSSGALAVLIMGLVLRMLLKIETNTNWHPEDAAYKMGKVYLKIPQNGFGIIHVKINGANRELKATTDEKDIKTGETIIIEEYKNGIAKVVLAKDEKKA